MLIRPPTRIPSTPDESPAMVRDARYRLSHSTTPMYGKTSGCSGVPNVCRCRSRSLPRIYHRIPSHNCIRAPKLSMTVSPSCPSCDTDYAGSLPRPTGSRRSKGRLPMPGRLSRPARSPPLRLRRTEIRTVFRLWALCFRVGRSARASGRETQAHLIQLTRRFNSTSARAWARCFAWRSRHART